MPKLCCGKYNQSDSLLSSSCLFLRKQCGLVSSLAPLIHLEVHVEADSSLTSTEFSDAFTTPMRRPTGPRC